MPLGDLSGASGRLDLMCGACGRPWSRPLQELEAEHDEASTLGAVLMALRCPRCQGRPEEAILMPAGPEQPGVPILGPRSY